MAKDPAFLFYPNDWLGGTLGMTFEEKGAYMELLMLQFNRGHMSGHMIGQTVGQLFGQIQSKFKIDADGLYYNERLDLEIERRKAYCSSRKNNIEGKNQHSKKGGHTTTHMIGHMENENINTNESINKGSKGGSGEKKGTAQFDSFWSAYPRKTAKQAAQKAWDKFKPNDTLLTTMLSALAIQKRSATWTKDGGQFIPHPATWLNGRRWEDEVTAGINTDVPDQYTERI